MAISRRRALRAALPAGLILGLALTLFHSLEQTSVTVDEFAHLPAGLVYWQTGEFAVYRHNPPLLRLLAAAPLAAAGVEAPLTDETLERWWLGVLFMREHAERYHDLFMAARTVPVLLTSAMALLLFEIARRGLGYWPAVTALALLCWSPTVLAHGGLVTTDVGLALAFLAAAVAGARFLAYPSWPTTFAFGALLGLAQLTKFTALILYPILAIAVLALPWVAKCLSGGRELGWLALSKGERTLHLVAAVALSLIVLNAGYLFQGTGLPLRAYRLGHPLLQPLAESPLGALPFPLPADYLLGFDAQYSEASGSFHVYLLGELGSEGWWYYYPLALLFKTPLPLFLLLGALALRLLRGATRPTPLLAGCLGVPAFALVVFVLLTNIDLGVRYLVFLLPFLHLAAAHLASPPVSTRLRAFLIVCLVWYGASSLATHPHYLAYFSELCGRAGRGHLFLADSNLDWGQDLVRLRRFMEQRGIPSVALSHFGVVDPNVYGIAWEPLGPAPQSDTVVISVNHLLGIHPGGRPAGIEGYRGREPSARVGYSLWVFEREAAEGRPSDDSTPSR